MYRKKELANVGLKMEDKKEPGNFNSLCATPLPHPHSQPTQNQPNTLAGSKTNIEAPWLRSNGSVEMKMFTHKSLKKMSENNFCL